MPRSLKLFLFFTALGFVSGSVIYLVLHALMPNGYVFGMLPRMFLYQYDHPFQYIAVVALTYATFATVSVICWGNITRWRMHLMIIAILVLTVVAASIPGGVLWKIHDMQAGFFTKGTQFWSDLFWGATTGLEAGWLIAGLSIPFNILVFILGYFITLHGFKLGKQMTQPKLNEN